MRLLSRYLVGTMLAPFLFALVALTCMLLLNHISRALPDLVGKGLPAAVIVEALVLSLPFIIALTMPMAVLVAVLYGFSHLAADSELTAMKANGVSVFQMLRPALVCGVAISLTCFFFVDQVLPRSNARLKALRSDIARKKPTVALRVQAINELPPSTYYLRASRIDAGSGHMRDVVLFDMGQIEGRRIIYADSGRMAFQPNGQDLAMELFAGRVHDYRNDNPGSLQVTAFANNVILVRGVQNDLGRTTGDFDEGEREKSTCEMLVEVALAERRMVEHRDRRLRLTFRDLRVLLGLQQPALAPFQGDTTPVHRCGPWAGVDGVMKRLLLPAPAAAQEPEPTIRPIQEAPELTLAGEAVFARSQHDEAGATAYRYRVEIHKKLSISVACLNFVIIGIALALRWPRGGIGLVMGGSVLIFTVFYVGLTSGESLADRGMMSPAMAMWAPNILLFVIGAIGLARVSRYGGSARGGDIADLFATLTGWMRRRPAA